MKQVTQGRDLTPLSACYTISLRSTAWERLWHTCVLTIVYARIRTVIWREMVRLHQQIILSFLIVGHTKFSPDWCFGLLQQRFHRTRVGCLADLEQAVNISAEANVTQLVGTQSGEVVVRSYNWTLMFAGQLKKLKHIKKYHHFKISASTLGPVCVKMESDSEEEHISLLIDHTWAPTRDNLPPVVVPSGLSLERQWYLHNQITEYCPPEVRDIVCPQPLTPLSCATSTTASTSTAAASMSTAAASMSTAAASTSTAAASTSTTAGNELTPTDNSHQATASAEHHQLPPAKRARVCSKCNTAGHNARTCGK